MTHQELNDYLKKKNIYKQQFADILDCSSRSIERWCNGTVRVPKAVSILVDLDVFDVVELPVVTKVNKVSIRSKK